MDAVDDGGGTAHPIAGANGEVTQAGLVEVYGRIPAASQRRVTGRVGRKVGSFVSEPSRVISFPVGGSVGGGLVGGCGAMACMHTSCIPAGRRRNDERDPATARSRRTDVISPLSRLWVPFVRS